MDPPKLPSWNISTLNLSGKMDTGLLHLLLPTVLCEDLHPVQVLHLVHHLAHHLFQPGPLQHLQLRPGLSHGRAQHQLLIHPPGCLHVLHPDSVHDAPAVSLPIIFIYNIIRFNFIPNIIILILHFLYKTFITTFSDHFYFIFTNFSLLPSTVLSS